MPNPDDEYTMTGVVATTGALTGRSFRLGLAYLEKLRDGLVAGEIEMGFDHDPRQATMPARLTAAEIRHEESGEYALYASWLLSADQVEQVGDRRAFSVTTVDWEVDGWEGPEDPDILIIPDCYYWDDEDIAESLRAATLNEVKVGGGRLIQLSAEPPIRVIIDILNKPEVMAAYWAAIAAVVGALVAKLWKRSKDKEMPHAKQQLVFEVKRETYKAVVSCETDEGAAKIAAQVVDAVKTLGIPEASLPLQTASADDTESTSSHSWTQPM